MCGINGIFAYADAAAPVDEAELLRTREHMARRGPDGAGLWISADRKVGLAHRRLAIIDLSETGAQPMATADGRLTITYNGEIYNYRELRRELEAKGYAFRSQSDTEVLLHLYADRGVEMVHALRGMFAFGIWDEREKTLFLARDPFGIKPLYYADAGGSLRFASQVKAIVAGGAVRTTQDVGGWAGFFVWGAIPEPLTTLRQVRSLPAGSLMTVAQSGRPRTREYFSISARIRDAESAAQFPIESPHELHRALEESVGYHLVADVSVGMFLSAGVDSSLIARFAVRRDPGLRTITLGFEEFRNAPQDETGGAEALARELGTRHTTRWIGAGAFESVRAGFLDAMDQPTIDGLNTFLISKVAAEEGIKVALSGLGGDEFFGGYPSFRQAPALARSLAWSARIPAAGRFFRRATAAAFDLGGAPKYAGLLEYGATIPGAYLLRRAVYMPWELERLMAPAAAREGLNELRLAVPELVAAGPRGDWAKVSVLESSCYMKNMLLRDSDWAAMAHGVEIRLPLVDAGIFRLASEAMGAGRPLTKLDLLRAVNGVAQSADHVPPKRGFTVPMGAWLTGDKRAPRGGRGSRQWAKEIAQDWGCAFLERQAA